MRQNRNNKDEQMSRSERQKSTIWEVMKENANIHPKNSLEKRKITAKSLQVHTAYENLKTFRGTETLKERDISEEPAHDIRLKAV